MDRAVGVNEARAAGVIAAEVVAVSVGPRVGRAVDLRGVHVHRAGGAVVGVVPAVLDLAIGFGLSGVKGVAGAVGDVRDAKKSRDIPVMKVVIGEVDAVA